jgi:cell division protein FtsB
MEITIKEALEALRPLAIQAKSALRLTEVLNGLVGVENHRDELTREVEALQRKMGSDSDACDAARTEADEYVAKAKREAFAIVNDATTRATMIADECRLSVASTAAEVQDLVAEGNIRLAGPMVQRAALVTEVEALTRHRDALVAEVDGLRDRLKSLVG